MANSFSVSCFEILERLAASKNVLVSGAPGTGKSLLLGEVADAFSLGLPKASPSAVPMHDPKAAVPIPPAASPTPPGYAKAMPSPSKHSRKIFRTVFHQNSKHRDFVTGMLPNTLRQAGEPDFIIIKGILFEASEHARRPDGASLLIIDEINRGPAVQVFGGAIVAIEADKRLGHDGKPTRETQVFEILDPNGKGLIPYALPSDLYILAAMNQADASVEPLDVAFLRRWEPFGLEPDEQVLRSHFGITGSDQFVGDLPPSTAEAKVVLEASVRAWLAVNRRIALGRGPDFQIGHGVLMNGVSTKTPYADAAIATAKAWAKVRTHVQEVFFGDIRSIAATLNAVDGPAFHPLRLEEATFGDDIRFILKGPGRIDGGAIYDALRAISA